MLQSQQFCVQKNTHREGGKHKESLMLNLTLKSQMFKLQSLYGMGEQRRDSFCLQETERLSRRNQQLRCCSLFMSGKCNYAIQALKCWYFHTHPKSMQRSSCTAQSGECTGWEGNLKLSLAHSLFHTFPTRRKAGNLQISLFSNNYKEDK